MNAARKLIPLHNLTTGQAARVGQLVGRPEHVQRLRELGLRDGMKIEMVQPGSPCIIRFSGNKLCFRRCDDFHVLVKS